MNFSISEPEFNKDQQRFRERMLFLVKELRQRCQTEVGRHSRRMRSVAKRFAPKANSQPGLRDQITERYENDGLTGIVESGARYAQWVEGVHHNYVLGRGPGRMPPLEPIYAWVLFRRLDIKWNMTPRSATFLVRRKIARRGTKAQPHMKPGFEQVGPEI